MLSYLSSALKQFQYYKMLGDKTMAQLSDEELFMELTEGVNSISIIVNHLHGNMLSRWTDFLTSDGEKETRNRDGEFLEKYTTRADVDRAWNAGWEVLFQTMESLKDSDLESIVYIRNQGHTVTEAINRQLCHYSYHVGQMVFIGKLQRKEKWESLSIPRNASAQYNAERFSKEKGRGHFTDSSLSSDLGRVTE